MKSQFRDWDALKRRIRQASLLALFLDFDGTLSRIVERPEAARMDPGIAEILERLARRPKVRMAITSGRDLADLKKKVPLKGLWLAGCHGLELEGPGLDFVHPEANRNRPAVREMAEALSLALKGVPGALVEEKKFSVAAHYRRVPKPKERAVRERIRSTVASRMGNWKIIPGKKVMEIMPETGWSKGSCVTLLLCLFRSELPQDAEVLPVYLGDDLTDQDGFDAVREQGVAVAVGRGAKLRADHRLKDVSEVRNFLVNMADALSSSSE